MKTLTCTANLYDQRNTEEWVEGYARQGKYQYVLHRGLLVFPELAGGALRGRDIQEIQFDLTCSKSGYARNKTMYMKRAYKTEPGGTATDWVGESIGSANALFYNRPLSINVKTSAPELYAGLRTWLQEGGQAIALFVEEEPKSGYNYSDNYMGLSEFSMTIVYEDGNLWRHDGEVWNPCEAYYHNGNEFVRCAAYRHNGTEWEL